MADTPSPDNPSFTVSGERPLYSILGSTPALIPLLPEQAQVIWIVKSELNNYQPVRHTK